MGSERWFDGRHLTGQLEDSEDGVVVTLVGELDVDAASSLSDRIEAEASWERPVAIDLAQVSYCDSAGLSVLIRCHLLAESAGGRFVVRQPPDRIRSLLEFTGLDTHLQIEP